MKYILLLGDGMADLPIKELGNKTPLDVANKPCMDSLVPHSILGLVKTVPEGYKPGSDVANLSALGYDPKVSYSGRSPLEALSIGIDLKDTDVAIRCNVVTLSDEEAYEDKIMLDYSAGEISSEEAKELINSVESELGNELFHFYSGVSYRHCLIWENGSVNQELTPPHDILNKNINSYLPKNPKLLDLMKKSYDLLKNHPINLARMEKGLNPANSIWLWGEGTKPNLQNFTEKTGLKGSMISAVDLLKGMAIGSKMTSIDVDGATGTLHTNYKGKLDAATKTLLEDGNDFVYIHLEGPDECGHQGDMAGKISAIEQIDEKLLKPLLANLDEAKEDYRLLIMPDHPTPLCIRTHTNAAIPFMLYSSKNEYSGNLNTYSESSATSTGLIVEEGYTLINHLFDEKLNFK
jgi:proposed homoserine kinase